MADLSCEYLLTTPGPDITFNDGSLGDGVDKYWLTAIQGLDGPDIRAPVDPVPFGDGGLVHTFWLGPLRVIFDGMLLLEPLGTMEDCQLRRNDLAFDLQNALLSIVNVAGTLAWTPTGQAAQSLPVFNEVKLNITYSDNYYVTNFSFGLVSADALPT
jgi:hypothetical protein